MSSAGADLGHTIRQIVANAIITDEAIDVFDAARLPKPDISILSPEFLAEAHGMKHKNLAAALLRRLLDDEGRKVLVPPGARVPIAHHHVEVDEVVYGLEGVLTYRVGDATHTMRPGDRIFAPRGVEHHFANLNDSPARFLSVLTPAKIGPKFFREVAGLAAAGPPRH